MKIVLDANVLISGIFWSGFPRKILSFWLNGKISIITTIPIINEYLKTLERICHKYGKDDIFSEWEYYITEYSEVIEPGKIIVVKCRDADDDKFILAAISGNADYILSGDKDLLDLREAEGIEILSPREFIKRCED